MSVWPSTLPKPSPEGYQETLPDNTVRSEMEVGPAKIRKRATSATTKYRLTYHMTNTQVNTMSTFFSTTISDGVDSFDMDDPRSGSTEEFRIMGAPEISALSPIWFRVIISMEKLP